MTVPGVPIAEFADRLHEGAVSVLVDSSLHWASIVALAADMVAAGVDGPATVELAGATPDLRSDDCRRLFVAMLHELGLPEAPADPRVFAHFVRNDDFDSLLELVTVADIAGAWLRDARRVADDAGAVGSDEWANAVWYSAVWYLDRDRTRATVLEMIELAEPGDLARVGAGPLESLVTENESALRWVEENAAISSKFRAALTHAWLWNQLSTDAFARVERAAGTPLPKPDR